jgi:hypothetical protein
MWSCRGIFGLVAPVTRTPNSPADGNGDAASAGVSRGDGTTEMARVVSEWLGGERWIRLFLSPPRVLPVWQGRR